MTAINILVVEDEESIREMLTVVLEKAEFSVRTAVNTVEAQAILNDSNPDLILLDWTLPGLSGAEWARRLKKDRFFSDIPIIMVTARGEEEDKIRGFDIGADDYVTKPFSPRELVARITAVLRGTGKLGNAGRVELGGIELSIDEHRVGINGHSVNLSPMEYRLLEFFLTHPDKVYSRSQLLDMVWGRSSFIEERTVDVHIRRLRKVLEEHGREEMIQTVRGFGYRFSERG
jgi:two-component system phosphate regulon response regulator PhoB